MNFNNHLLPSSVSINGQDWGVFDTEFGKTYSADMRVLSPVKYPSCAESIFKSQLTARRRGDTDWEAPPMLNFRMDLIADDTVARAIAVELLNNFKQLDITALTDQT